MAYQYDEMGNVIGQYESDEERRQREAQEAAARAQADGQAQAQAAARTQAQAAAQQPVKQTVTYNPDGTKEMTIRGTPEALSPMNPNTPTVSGPVNPEDVFKRMQQVESGNRDFDAQGRPITSPAGAMYRNQVMPATAANPGYGIRPAQAQTPEEYNRVGQEYYQAMLQKFGGDTQKAAAAYNAGPGRVQQNIQANQGQMNVAQLPRETQGYLQKIGQAVSNIIPSAQAGTVPTAMPPGQNARDDRMMRPTVPVAPTAPVAMPPPDSVINNQVAQYEQRQAPALNLPPDPFQQYLNLQDNPKDLINFGYDATVPDNLQKRARVRAQELLTQEQGLNTAKEKLPTMTETEIARALREKTTGGSYVKAVLFGLLGMENSAMAEAAKLGIGREQSFTLDGKPVMVKVAANGTPIEGYSPETGRALTAKELVMSMGGGASKVKPDVSTQDVEATIDGKKIKGRVVTTYNAQNQPTTRVESGGKFYEYNGAWNPVSISAAATKADYSLIIDLKKKHGGNVLDALKSFEEIKGPQTPENRQEFLQLYGMGTTVPGGGAPAAGGGAPAAGGGAPGGAKGAGGVDLREPIGNLKAAQAGQKEIVTEAAKQVAASADTQNMLKSIDKITGLLDSGEHNVGSALSAAVGRGPIAQAIGAQFETTDAKNTKTILDTVNKLAADGLKALGSNPSTVDLEFWTRYKPDGSSDPAFVRDWIQSRSEDLKRRLGYAGTQASTGGSAGVAPAAGSGVPGTAGNPIKLK
jgi:soluble lytic murein transglycosylase